MIFPRMLTLLTAMVLVLGSLSSVHAEAPRLRPENWARPVISSDLDNWYRVDERLYRSAQPDDEGMAAAVQLGIGRVLDLREYHSDDDEAEGTGLQLYRVPMNAGKIKDADVVRALKIITASKQPILVHCWHGSDRTGTIVAMYRILVQGWSRKAALDELINGGYGYHSIYSNIPDYIRQVDIDKLREQLQLP